MNGYTFVLIIGAIAAIGIAAAIFPAFRRTLNIWGNKANDAATTPIDRELAAVREQEKIVANGRTQASNIRGSYNAQVTKLGELNDAVDAAKKDLELAKSMATTRIKGANKEITDEALGTALKSDSVVLGQAQKLQNAMRDRDIQKGVCDDMKKTVETTQQAVAAAQQKLTELQQSVHSDVARAEATKALSGAAQVLDTFKGLNGAGAALAREHGRVNEEYEQAKARLEDAQGDQAQRDFDAAKHAADLGSLIDAH